MIRRNFIGKAFTGLAGAIVGILGFRRADADVPNIKMIGKAAGSLRMPNLIAERIRAERDRLTAGILDQSISAERRAQYYAAQQALEWAISPEGFMSPSQAVRDNLCFWPAHDANPIGADEFPAGWNTATDRTDSPGGLVVHQDFRPSAG